MLAQYETQLKYRRIDENGDMIFGHGNADFLSDAEAMRQVLQTRLAACEGEWWEGDAGALPYFNGILGSATTDENREAIDLMVIDRIMDTRGVISVFDVESMVTNRNYSFKCKVQTVYGVIEAEVNT